MKIKIPDVFHNMSKRVIAAMTVGVVLPASTVIAFAANGAFSNSAVATSSTIPVSSYSSSYAVPSENSSVSSPTVSSDLASTNTVSSSPSKGSDNVASDIDAINKATKDGLDKINSAASKALSDIDSAKAPTPSSSSSKPKVINTFEIPDPYNDCIGYDGVTDKEEYAAAQKVYNDYAASLGLKQDAGTTDNWKSEAVRAWGKAHGWKSYQ